MTEEQIEHLQGRIIKNSTVQDNGCWTWNLYKNKRNGYGQFWVGRNDVGGYVWNNAHRVSYEVFHGPVPEGMEVAHKCHCRSCVNPNHLIATTHQENIQMSVDAGRNCKGEHRPNAKLTENIVRSIREGSIFQHLSIGAVARIFGVDRTTIRRVLVGETWSHVTI